MRPLPMPSIPRLAITTVSCFGIALSLLTVRMPTAHACGCFAPPDPSVPIVQAGERILFAMQDGEVTAHIQIQYSGEAEEFAWLVPLPAQPVVGVGTDELFTQVIATTQPRYRLIREYDGFCEFDPGGFNPGRGDGAENDAPSAPGAGEDPLVFRDTVGPYEIAVLEADSKEPMLQWLADNRFFVPAGTDTAVDPYIRPGAFFLALKLQKGNSVGDLQPVVLKYRSELPMIPIVLTSVAADPDMPVMVWVLGDSRAIPRNFYHTHINDAAIDWLNNGANYIDVVTRAVDEADGHHSFVTEYAGTSVLMRDVLDPPGRFGNVDDLGQLVDPIAYVQYLTWNGYTNVTGINGPFLGPVFSSQMLTILERYLPMPSELRERGLSPNDFYINFPFYLDQYRIEFPDKYETLYADFDPALPTKDIKERVVEPTLAAGKLFRDYPYLTRLFTTMSPDEMTKDPVFSFNPELPEVSNIHEARLVYECGLLGSSPGTTPARLITEQGWVLRMPKGESNYQWLDVAMPASRFTQILREEGSPEVVGDNSAIIETSIDEATESGASGGCTVTPGTGRSGLAGMLLLGLAAVLSLHRLRRPRRLDRPAA